MTLERANSRTLPKQRRRFSQKSRTRHLNRFVTDIESTGQEQISDEARFHARLLDMIDQAVTATSFDGSVIYQNRIADQLYGWSLSGSAALHIPQAATLEAWRARELEILARVSAGKSWSGEMLVHRWDGMAFPCLVTASPLLNARGDLIGTVSISTDITAQKQTEYRLEHYIKRLEHLRDTERAILSAQSPERIAEVAITQIQQLVPYLWASVTVFDLVAEEVQMLAVQSLRETSFEAGAYFPLDSFGVPEELIAGKVYSIEDIQALSRVEPITQVLKMEGARSYVRVPLMTHGELIGSLNLAAGARSAFTKDHIDIAQEVADQLAIAIYNAQLFTEVRRYATDLERRVAGRTSELSEANELLQRQIQERQQAEAAERRQRALAESLRDIARVLNSTLNLDEVLTRILDNVGRVVPHQAANIMFVEGETVRIARSQGYTQYPMGEAIFNLEFPIGEVPALFWSANTSQTMVISDTRQYPDWVMFPGADWVRSYAGAPISLEGKVIGFLNVDSAMPGFFTPVHAEALRIFADQAAIAIQNARLYEQSQALAALEERQRLSHELHDAVSQTLWSASLIADILPELWEQNAAKGRQKLIRLRQLTRGALAEMRTLLLELHPTALLEVGLGDLLQRLCEVITSRTGIAISPAVEGQVSLSPPAQVTLYRIAQEALNNVVRHAAASEVTVRLQCTPERLTLCIRDNGRGFVQGNFRPNHMGLNIMHERAQSIGALLTISSQVGQGTEVVVTWSPKKE